MELPKADISYTLKHGGYNDIESFTNVRIYKKLPFKVVVILTEPLNNNGTSITNSIERVAGRLKAEDSNLINVPVDNIIWIEHYEREKGIGDFSLVEMLYNVRNEFQKDVLRDRVLITPYYNPFWSALRVEDVTSLILTGKKIKR